MRRMVREPEVLRRNRRKWAKARRSTLAGQLAHSHRVAVRRVIKRRPGGKKSLEFLACRPEYLLVHIGRQLKPGMTARNYGRVWEIDHIKPIKAFNLNQRGEAERCFHFSNLQPLPKKENIRKGAKWDPADEAQVAARRRRAVAQYRAYLQRQ